MTHGNPVNSLRCAALALALWVSGTDPLFAHGSARGLVMLLPTGYYQTGAALAVAASFVLLLWLPRGLLRRLKACAPPLFHPLHEHEHEHAPVRWASLLSFCLLGALLAAGYLGNPDPLANPLPLSVWTLWWVGFTLLQCVFGNLWPLLNPWSGPLGVLGRLFPRLRPGRGALLKPPRALGYAPAFVLFLGFAWFELIDPAPDNPGRLADAVLGYWCFTLAACLLFGEKHWLHYAEPFSVFFRLIGGCSPFTGRVANDGRGNVRRPNICRLSVRLPGVCLPGAQLVSMAPMPLSGVLFVLLTLSAVSFDGFNKTFTWLGLLGINPLAFPGRSAVLAGNTLGLLLAFAALAAVFFLSVALGCRVAGKPEFFARACGRLIYSLIPISLVFHFAHYLAALLINSQYALTAFNDPFNLGWNLLAAENYRVTASFLTHLPSVTVIWRVQTVAIVLGHVIGITVAHLVAVELFGAAKTAAASQVFLAALMVAYTMFGLWLLSTPAIA